MNSLKEFLTKIRQTSIIKNCRLFMHKAVEMEQCVFVQKNTLYQYELWRLLACIADLRKENLWTFCK